MFLFLVGREIGRGPDQNGAHSPDFPALESMLAAGLEKKEAL
jgi:hypothetical protein